MARIGRVEGRLRTGFGLECDCERGFEFDVEFGGEVLVGDVYVYEGKWGSITSQDEPEPIWTDDLFLALALSSRGAGDS